MGSASAALGTAAEPIRFEWRGKTYAVRRMSVGPVITKLEQFLIAREASAKEEMYAGMVDRGRMGREEMIARLDAFTDDAVNNGRYGYGSARMGKIFGWIETRQREVKGLAPEQVAALPPPDGGTLGGILKFISILLDCEMDDVVEMLNEKAAELMQKISLAMTEAQPDPKA